MLKNVKAYRGTDIHWSRSQAEIQKLLEKYGIDETRFTTLSHDTLAKAGFKTESDSVAMMIEFFKVTSLASGVGGKVPIKIIIPNIPNEDKYKNQAYRIVLWYLKTKFEAVETGLIEFEQEFLAHIALGKGNGVGTMWQAFKEKIFPAIASGRQADISMLEPPRNDNKNTNETSD